MMGEIECSVFQFSLLPHAPSLLPASHFATYPTPLRAARCIPRTSPLVVRMLSMRTTSGLVLGTASNMRTLVGGGTSQAKRTFKNTLRVHMSTRTH